MDCTRARDRKPMLNSSAYLSKEITEKNATTTNWSLYEENALEIIDGDDRKIRCRPLSDDQALEPPLSNEEQPFGQSPRVPGLLGDSEPFLGIRIPPTSVAAINEIRPAIPTAKIVKLTAKALLLDWRCFRDGV